jgi:hypothetical protein
MDYLEQNIQKYIANEITIAELKKVLHFLIDDIVIPDAIYVKTKMQAKPADFSHLFKEGE